MKSREDLVMSNPDVSAIDPFGAAPFSLHGIDVVAVYSAFSLSFFVSFTFFNFLFVLICSVDEPMNPLIGSVFYILIYFLFHIHRLPYIFFFICKLFFFIFLFSSLFN